LDGNERSIERKTKMVEFGLKLEDNKVDEWYGHLFLVSLMRSLNMWMEYYLMCSLFGIIHLPLIHCSFDNNDCRSSQYIDYEKLKLVLKRAKASAEYRDEIIKRMPPGVVAEVFNERKDRMASTAAAAASSSSSSHGEKKVEETSSSSSTMKLGCSPIEESSTTSSRSSSSQPPTSKPVVAPTVTTPLLGNSPKVTSWGSNINHTVFKVTSYLGFANDRILLLQAYDDADDKLHMFEQSYEQEVSSCIEIC
jgi:hypothetical protein